MEYFFNYLIHIRRTPAPMPIARIWCHDLTFVHSGEFTYEVEDQRFTVRAGEALYCPKKAARLREKSEEAYYTSLNFQVIPESTLNLPYHIKRADSAELRFYLKRLLQVYKAGGKYVQEKCSSLMSLIVCTLTELNPIADENHYVSEIKAIIDAEPARRYSVAELADRVYLNPSYLSKLFRETSGSTISEYALSRQLEYAAKLLEAGENVRSTAEKAGFCDMYYFSRVFSRSFGASPSEYRRACLETGVMTDEIIVAADKSKPKGTQKSREKSKKTH